MIWLQPAAWFAVAAAAVPLAVHLLSRQRARRMPFPTLRFIPATRLAAVRRRAIDDLPLLAIRVAIVAAAVAAFAGPLATTARRHAAWNARSIAAIVALPTATEDAPQAIRRCAAPDCRVFEGSDLRAGIHRAVAWLDAAPPARRELVIAAPLTLGSLTDADLASVPNAIGIRFERTPLASGPRTIEAPALLAPAGTIARTVTLEGGDTTVRERLARERAPQAIDVAAPAARRAAADAAIHAALSLRMPVPPPERRVRIILADGETQAELAGAEPITAAWMADAIVRVAGDQALNAEAARVAAGLTDPLNAPTWQVLVRAADSRPAASASSIRLAAGTASLLAVATRTDVPDLFLAELVRAAGVAVVPPDKFDAAEVLPIPDRQLGAWTRAPGPPPAPRADTIDRDDRRWMWGAVLALLAAEWWLRRRTPNPEPRTQNPELGTRNAELSHVA